MIRIDVNLIFPRLLALHAISIVLTTAHGAELQSPPMGVFHQHAAATADFVFGLPIHRAPVWVGATDSVSDNEVTISTTLIPGEWVTGSDRHYVWITSGKLTGYRFTATANSRHTVTLEPHAGETVAVQGLQAGDTLQVIPFWTLNTLFPEGKGIQPSSDFDSPGSTVRLHHPESIGTDITPSIAYFYYNGNQRSVGWYEVGHPEDLQNDVLLLPETYITFRNTSSIPQTISLSGYAPNSPFGISVSRTAEGRPQDNLVVNPYPVEMSLQSLGLPENELIAPSPDVTQPRDTVRLFGSRRSYDLVPSDAYLLHDGSQGPPGWYNINRIGELQDQVSIPPGGAMIVRKHSGPVARSMWIPPLPYQP